MFESWVKEFENKKILIWGYGIEGKSTYRFIRKICPDLPITVADGGKGLNAAMDDTVHTVCLSDKGLDLNQFDLIFKAPGIIYPKHVDPSKITSEAEMFLRHYSAQTIGITGTKGKSTTTSLVAQLLKEKYETVLVGNIGKACFDEIEAMENGALAAFEIACHQLENNPYSPHVGVYLNLYEEHLDHYDSFEAYGDAKFNVMKNQGVNDIALINKDLTQYIERLDKKPVLIGEEIYAEDHVLHIPGHTLKIDDCKLLGDHNYNNLAVAYYIANLYGVSDEQVKHAVASFMPLHHRIENIGTKDGITYINDSISTIGQAAIQALKSLQDVSVIIIGGMDRGISYDELEDYLYERKDVQVIFMYSTGKRILHELQQKNLIRQGYYSVEDLEEAVTLSKKICEAGKLCLLSPAASSYDHFKNFEERGAVFAKLALENA